MDILNSILNAMDKPPMVNEDQKLALRKQQELREKQKKNLQGFRQYVEERMQRFARDERTTLEFQPLDNIHRGIIREIAECGGFMVMSFGIEGEDRHSVVYKKEYSPSEDEIDARRNGRGWNAVVQAEYADRRREQQALAAQYEEMASRQTADGDHADRRSCHYADKYVHIIGQTDALQAVCKTQTNQTYGIVPSKNKKDVRSIEQTLADIQAKKKRKLETDTGGNIEDAEQEQQQPVGETNGSAAKCSKLN